MGSSFIEALLIARHIRFGVPIVATALLTGCNDGLVDVNARVMLDGEPLQGAAVSLVSADEARNRTASGMTGTDGYVQFTTFQPNDGVLPGTYKVVVVKSPGSVAEEMATYDRDNPADLERIMARERSGNVAYTPTLLPRIYLSPETTPLELKVPPDEDDIVFSLTRGKKK